MKIRKATKKDVERVVELFGEYDRYENALDKRHKIDTLKERKDFFNLLIKSKRAVILVLEIDSKVQGVISGEYRETIMGKGCIFHELIISKDYRGKGYGEQLMKALEEQFKKIGCKSVTSFVFIKNKGVLKFYNKLGYSSKEEGYFIRKRLK